MAGADAASAIHSSQRLRALHSGRSVGTAPSGAHAGRPDNPPHPSNPCKILIIHTAGRRIALCWILCHWDAGSSHSGPKALNPRGSGTASPSPSSLRFPISSCGRDDAACRGAPAVSTDLSGLPTPNSEERIFGIWEGRRLLPRLNGSDLPDRG